MRLMPESVPLLIGLEPLLESAIRSTALIAVAALVVLALRRAPASMRHLVWTLALLGCVAMPLASRVVPGWSVPGLPAWPSPSGSVTNDPGPAPTASVTPAPDPSGPAFEPAPMAAAERATRAPAGLVWRPRGGDVLRALPVLWLAGVLLLLGRHVLAWASLSRVARRAGPMTDHDWQVALARHAVTLGLPRVPALRVSPRLTVPIVCGALRPTILLPVEALGWTAGRRDAVLLHELAHVRRFDLVTARVTQLASTLYWFHPLVWLAARSQRLEAERACDDRVLDAGGRASAYASDLLEIARAIGRREPLDAAALAMARRSQLEGRLLAILDPRQPRGAAGRLAIAVSVLLATAGIVVLAAARPAQSRPDRKVEAPALVSLADPLQVSEPNQGASKRRTAASSSLIAALPSGTTPAAGMPPAGSTGAPMADPAGGLLAAGSADEPPAMGSSHWSSSGDGRSVTRIGSWNHKDSRGSFKSKGRIRFSDALDDIESISPGGYVEIEDRRGGAWHKAVFRSRSGELERSYSVDGAERPWDDEARAWLARFLVTLDQGSGMFADQRFPRLMAEGGPARVLREVSDLSSDYVRSVYFRKLIETGPDAPTVRRVVAQAGREIRSDYELARTLIAAAQHTPLGDAATGAAFLEAANGLESDYEHARVLLVLVERRDLAPALADGAIASAARMDSDYEQARLMIAMARQGHVKPPLQRSYIRATQSIESSYEKGRVLRALLDRESLSGESVGEILLASATISSDYERANVLVRLAGSARMGEEERAAFVESAEGVGSDYERGRALAALGRSLKR